MRINPISSGIYFNSVAKLEDRKLKRHGGFYRNNLIPATGYLSLGFGIASGVTGIMKRRRIHGITGMVALAAAMAHVYLLKSTHGLFHRPERVHVPLYV